VSFVSLRVLKLLPMVTMLSIKIFSEVGLASSDKTVIVLVLALVFEFVGFLLGIK